MKTAAIVNPTYVYTVKIKLPWLLRWAEGYITIKLAKEELGQLKGQHYNGLIIDEVQYMEERKNGRRK